MIVPVGGHVDGVWDVEVADHFESRGAGGSVDEVDPDVGARRQRRRTLVAAGGAVEGDRDRCRVVGIRGQLQASVGDGGYVTAVGDDVGPERGDGGDDVGGHVVAGGGEIDTADVQAEHGLDGLDPVVEEATHDALDGDVVAFDGRGEDKGSQQRVDAEVLVGVGADEPLHACA